MWFLMHTKPVPLTHILPLAFFLEWGSPVLSRPFHFYVCLHSKVNLLRQRWSVSGDGQIEFLTLPLVDIVWFLFWTYIYMFWLCDISLIVVFARFQLAATSGECPASLLSVQRTYFECPRRSWPFWETLNSLPSMRQVFWWSFSKQTVLRPTMF